MVPFVSIRPHGAGGIMDNLPSLVGHKITDLIVGQETLKKIIVELVN